MNWYCDAAPGHPEHEPYHDHEYGFPGRDESELFDLLAQEIFQPGLSWLIVLKKRPASREAFDGFNVDKVAAYTDDDLERLVNNPGIIRNRLKIKSIIHNASVIKGLRDSHDGFGAWLDAHHPLSKKEWFKLFKKTFKFCGPSVTEEFLMGTGYLPGSHREDCPAYKAIAEKGPAWMSAPDGFYKEE